MMPKKSILKGVVKKRITEGEHTFEGCLQLEVRQTNFVRIATADSPAHTLLRIVENRLF